eukprot:5489082-Alexandrium_andersonii.AAC.1
MKASLRLEPRREADVAAGYKERHARQRRRGRVKTLQRVAVCAGYLPPAKLVPSECPTSPAVRGPARGPGNPCRGAA